MEYSEYYKIHKIRYNNKSLLFVHALKLFQEKVYPSKESNDRGDKAKKILEHLLSVIKNNSFNLDNTNKIIINESLMIECYKNKYFKENTYLADNIFKNLITSGIISKRSTSIIKAMRYIDSNPNTDCYIETDFNYYDKVLTLRDELLTNILEEVDLDKKEEYLFIYLYLFSINKFDDNIIKNFQIDKLENLDGKIALIFVKSTDILSYVKIIFFDEHLNEVFRKLFFHKSTNILDKIYTLFVKSFRQYEKVLNIYLAKHFTNLKIPYAKKMIKQQINLEHQLHNTPFQYTLRRIGTYPQINYLELVALFPKIKNETFIKIEQDNIAKHIDSGSFDEDDLYEMSLEKYMKEDIGLYDDLKKIRRFDVTSKDDFHQYKKNLNSIIMTKYGETHKFYYILSYIDSLTKKSKHYASTPEKLSTKYIQDSLYILIPFCFNIILKEGKLDEYTLLIIEEKLSNMSNDDSKRNYKIIINQFLSKFNMSINSQNKHKIYVKKSLIFKSELDQLFQRLVDDETNHHIVKYQKFIFCALLYYSGLRFQELRTRLINDIYIYDDIIYIDVNTKGMKKVNQIENGTFDLKTPTAKRRVEIKINDLKYLELVKLYLSALEESKVKFLFPKILNLNDVSEEIPQSESYFNSINNDIKIVTNRYATLHSFRHSFITISLAKILSNPEKQKNLVYNLIVEIGHGDPSTTLKYYAHIDWIINFYNKELLVM
jgi:integrase